MRLLSENHLPPNIKAFYAATLSDALLEADEALRSPNIQGAIWLNSDFDGASRQPRHFYTDLDVNIEGTTRAASAKVNDASNINFSFEGAPFADTELSRVILAKGLLETPKEIRLNSSLRFILEEEAYPHTDSHKQTGTANDSMLFGNMPIRIVQCFHGTGTLVYDPNETTSQAINMAFGNVKAKNVQERFDGLGAPWEVANGDALFVTTRVWGIEKALIHSAPEKRKTGLADARIIKKLDFFPK